MIDMFKRTNMREMAWSASLFALAIAGYFLVLALPVPTSVSMNARDEILVPLICTALYGFALSFNGKRGLFLSLTLILVLFALPLSALWRTGLTNESIIGGLLPFSDASSYYLDAYRLIDNGMYSEFSTRRPLFAGELAALLQLTKGNLQLTFAILVLITATAVYLASMQLRKNLGSAAAALFMLFCFLFYRRFIGLNLTEHLGLSLGVLGLALLWWSAVERKAWGAFIGMFVLTVALNARAGAFLVLPALVVWVAFYFRDGRTLSSFKVALAASASILLGFAANQMLLLVAGNSKGEAFSNFSYVFYGMVFGGDWQLAVKEPPAEIVGLSGKVLTHKLYEITITAVMDKPALLMNGMLRAWKAYVLEYINKQSGFLVIDLANPENTKYFYPYILDQVQPLVVYAKALALQIYRLVFLVLTCSGCYWAYRNRKREGGLILAVLAGIFLSIPFVPPWDADGGRIYAATIPMLVLMLAYGLSNLVAKYGWLGREEGEEDRKADRSSDVNSRLAIGLSLILLLLSVGGPIMIKYARPHAATSENYCVDGKTPLTLTLLPGSYLALTNDGRDTAVPQVQIHDFSANMERIYYLYPDIYSALQGLNRPGYLLLHNKGYVFIDPKYVSAKDAVIHGCGRMKMVPSMYLYFVD